MRFGWVLLACGLGSACVLGTRGTTVMLESQCTDPITASVLSVEARGISLDPVEFESDEFELVRLEVIMHTRGATRESFVPARAEDVNEVFVEVEVHAGGGRGLRFVTAVPAKMVNGYEYEFPDGPVVIEGDRCPEP